MRCRSRANSASALSSAIFGRQTHLFPCLKCGAARRTPSALVPRLAHARDLTLWSSRHLWTDTASLNLSAPPSCFPDGSMNTLKTLQPRLALITAALVPRRYGTTYVVPYRLGTRADEPDISSTLTATTGFSITPHAPPSRALPGTPGSTRRSIHGEGGGRSSDLRRPPLSPQGASRQLHHVRHAT